MDGWTKGDDDWGNKLAPMGLPLPATVYRNRMASGSERLTAVYSLRFGKARFSLLSKGEKKPDKEQGGARDEGVILVEAGADSTE